MSAVSDKPGPVIWLTACCHGDEVCGVVIIQEIFRHIKNRLLCGSINAFPLMNPIGFETSARNITLSQEDLNRCFPGDAEGTLGQRIAQRIFTAIIETKPDLLIDLHTDWKQSIPYGVIDHNPGARHKVAYNKAISLASQTGFICIRETDTLRTSLSYNMLLQDVPAITLELGEPYVINEENVSYGIEAIHNVLAHLGMISPRPEPFQFSLSTHYQSAKHMVYSDRPYSSRSGIIRFLAKPGDSLKKGDAFARIINTFGKHQETLKAENDAIVLGHSDSSVVFPGMPVMAFALPK